MANDPEPAKLLLPYLQRADELQKHEPLVAYYCRLYAMDRGLKIPAAERTKTTNALLNSLMKQLEKDKKALTLGPEDNLYLEGFAMNVFAKADKQDRAGRADLNTAKTFYAASIFFEILNQFGPLQPDLEQKQKYAAWKAADVRKALKEGRKPLPGPPAGDDDLSILSNTPSGSYGFGPNEAAFGNAGSEADSPPQIHDKMDNQRQHSADIPPSSSYPSHDFHPPPSTISASSTYSSSYQHPTYPQEDPHPSQNYPPDLNNHLSRSYSAEQAPQMLHNYPSEPQHHVSHNYISESQQHLSNNYPSQEVPAYSYPHFQSYPSFAETSLPSVPSHYPYYQGPDASYPPQSDHTTKNYTSTAPAQYGAGNRNGTASEAPPMQKYEYDSNYQPPPEKIAEAHKSARFAVGALAFDDVSVAVDYLRKSLELLTNPSAGQ